MNMRSKKRLGLSAFVFFLLLYCAAGVYSQQIPRFRLISTFGQKGIEQGQMNSPQGISVNIKGDIFISDTGNNRIQKFSGEGKFIKLVGGFGWGTAQFDEPVSVWARDGLRVLIADKNNHRIMHYDSNLNFVTAIDGADFHNESLRFRFPVGILRSDPGDLFIIDSENNRIVRINSVGIPEHSFGGYGSPGNPLINPVKIAAKGSDKIYVSDAGRKEIVTYDYFGNYLIAMGKGVLQQPAGLDIDEKGNILVCDTPASQVKVFNSAGQIIFELAHPAFIAPVDIACARNRVYILDKENAAVSIFEVVY